MQPNYNQTESCYLFPLPNEKGAKVLHGADCVESVDILKAKCFARKERAAVTRFCSRQDAKALSLDLLYEMFAPLGARD